MNRRLFIGALGAASTALGMGRAALRKPTYIFLMIGDGMGTAQREAAERYRRLATPSRTGRLAMNRLPVRGVTSTDEITGRVTDSAAAGTALACGVKTVNGALGVGQDKTTPLRSVAYDAQAAGMKVGIVTSVPIDHATPAAFYARVPQRGMYYEIDEYMARSGFNYFAGETMLGRNKANDKTPPDQLLKSAGYKLVKDRRGFDALKPGDDLVFVEKDLGYAINGPQDISLADTTRKGIELLDNDDGFFMMVEGGKIDWSGHANDLATNIKETLAFDEAVDVVLKFCAAHPDESLLIVTADHETGGLNLQDSPPVGMAAVIDQQKRMNSFYVDQVNRWKQSGTVSAEDALEQLSEWFGFEPLSEESGKHLLKAIRASLSPGTADSRDPAIQNLYGKRNAAVIRCLHELAARAGAEWTTFGHTGTRVTTTAWGPWGNRFGGETDNTDIGKRIQALIKKKHGVPV